MFDQLISAHAYDETFFMSDSCRAISGNTSSSDLVASSLLRAATTSVLSPT